MALGVRRVFVCFLNDDDKEVQGFFYLMDQTPNYISIKSGNNLITIPYHRLKKMKEVLSDG
jgi:hypothetical protein